MTASASVKGSGTLIELAVVCRLMVTSAKSVPGLSTNWIWSSATVTSCGLTGLIRLAAPRAGRLAVSPLEALTEMPG